MDYREQIDELLTRARSFTHGPTKVALTDEAVRLADSHNDIDAGFRARMQFIEAANFAGQPDRMLVAFSWCQAQVDRFPDRFDMHGFLWRFKWVCSTLENFPQVTLQQIEALFAEMERRYLVYGASLQVVHKKRRDFAIEIGDFEGAKRAHRAMATLKRDSLSDCQACEYNCEILYHNAFGDDARAVAAAQPILDGRYKCAVVPHSTFAKVLVPLLRLGRGREALAFESRGYRLISKNPEDFISTVGRHMTFLALIHNFPRALRYLEKHFQSALMTCSPGWQFNFYRGAKILFEQLRSEGRMKLRLRMPEAFPCKTESNEYTVELLRAWFTDQVMDLARRFDARNGNDYHTRQANESEELMKFATPIPIVNRSGRDA
jgi:hypothetical protein